MPFYLLIMMMMSLFLVLSMGAIVDPVHWIGSNTQSDPFAPNWELHCRTANFNNVYVGAKLVVKVTKADISPSSPTQHLANLNLSVNRNDVVRGSDPVLVEGAAVQIDYSVQTDDLVEFSVTLFDSSFDLGGFVVRYSIFSPVYVELQFYSSVTTIDDWELISTYHHSGMSPYSQSPLPPLSWEKHPTDNYQYIGQLFQIQNGFFHLDQTALIFADKSYSNPVLLPSPEQLIAFPELSSATITIEEVLEPEIRLWLKFDAVPPALQSLKFSLTSTTPFDSVDNTIRIFPVLRTQRLVPNNGFISQKSFLQIPISQPSNQNALVSISPSSSGINNVKLQFQIYTIPNIVEQVALVPSALTNLIFLKTCAVSADSPNTQVSFVNGSTTSRFWWNFLIQSSSTVSSVVLIECQALTSSFVRTYSQSSLLKESLFDFKGRMFSPPQSLSTRRELLQPLYENTAPYSYTMTSSYSSRIRTYTDLLGNSHSFPGSVHSITIKFPGLFAHSTVRMTFPNHLHITGASFAHQSTPTFVPSAQVLDPTGLVNTPLSPPSPIPTIPIDIISEDDETTTWLMLFSGSVWVDMTFTFDVYRPMSKEDTVAVTDGLVYVDSNSQPIPPDSDQFYFGVVKHSSLSTLDSEVVPGLDRYLDIPIENMPLNLPPSISTPIFYNYVTPTQGGGKTAFFFYLSQIPKQPQDPLSPYNSAKTVLYANQDLYLVIRAQWKPDFMLINIKSPPGFTTAGISDSTIRLRVVEDIEVSLESPLSFLVSILWKTPSRIAITPTFDFTAITPNAPALVVPLSISFAAPLVSYSTKIQWTPISPQNQLSLTFNHPTSHVLSSAVGEFFINSNHKIDLMITFGSEVISTSNVPEIFIIRLFQYSTTQNKPSLPPLLLGTVQSSDYSLDENGIMTLSLDYAALAGSLSLVKFAYLELSYTFPDESALPLDPAVSDHTQVSLSPLFTILPDCLAPTGLGDVLQSSNWKSNCGSYGKCSIDGKCQCDPKHFGQFCETQVDLCANKNCNSQNTAGCDNEGGCVCKPDWAGAQCSVLQTCLAQSNLSCSGVNGVLIPNDQKCGNKCQCSSNWMGSSCQLCSLQCQNQGKPFKKCDKCGCVAGFTGETCQCQHVVGYVQINAYSKSILDYVALIPPSGDSSSLESNFQSLSLFFSYVTLYNELTAHFISEMGLDPQSGSIIDFGQITSSSIGHGLILDLKTTPIQLENVAAFRTEFSVSIRFGCDEYNAIDSLDEITAKWDRMIGGFIQSVVIQDNFIFFDNSAIVSELNPGEPTIPTDPYVEPRPNTGVVVNHIGAITTILAFVAFFAM
jgi:hypothetical protein